MRADPRNEMGGAQYNFRHLHSQPLHLASAQFDPIFVSSTPDRLTEQLAIYLKPGPCLRATGYKPAISHRSLQIRIKPFVHLVDKLLSTTQSRRLSDSGVVVCIPRVPKSDVFFDLLCTGDCQQLAHRMVSHDQAHRQRKMRVVLK